MSILATLRLAVRALWRSKVRSLLTMLGIVFGIGAVIAMVAFGQGAQHSVREVFASLGTNVLQVSNASSRTTMGPSAGASGGPSITWDDVAAIEAEVPTVKWVAPTLETRGTQVIADTGENWNTSITGTTATWFKIRDWKAEIGRVFDEDTGASTEKVAVIGATVARQLFGGASALGQIIRINGQPYEVIGVLTSKGQGPRGDNDDLILIPLKTYQQKLERQGVAKYMRGRLLVSMHHEDQSETTIARISALLRDRHKLDSNDEDDFRIGNPADFAKARQDSTERISTLLAVVAGVSLLVGGIGVMNIMLVSVIERTREIGIRMAVGAKPRDVMSQFLIPLIYENTPGTRFAIDAEALHRQPELLKPFGRFLHIRMRVLDTLAYLACLLGVLAAFPVGWWTAGVGLVACVLTLAANRKTAGRLARGAAQRSTESFRQLHEMGCLWLVKG